MRLFWLFILTLIGVKATLIPDELIFTIARFFEHISTLSAFYRTCTHYYTLVEQNPNLLQGQYAKNLSYHRCREKYCKILNGLCESRGPLRRVWIRSLLVKLSGKCDFVAVGLHFEDHGALPAIIKYPTESTTLLVDVGYSCDELIVKAVKARNTDLNMIPVQLRPNPFFILARSRPFTELDPHDMAFLIQQFSLHTDLAVHYCNLQPAIELTLPSYRRQTRDYLSTPAQQEYSIRLLEQEWIEKFWRTVIVTDGLFDRDCRDRVESSTAFASMTRVRQLRFINLFQ